MIKTVNIKVSAGDPQAPIGPFYVFKASAASLTIVDVPKSLGARTITGVTVRAKNADGVEVGIAAVRNGSAWGGTIPASHFDREGTVSNGIVIQATGKSDDGTTAVTWIIGSGQLIILNDAGEITAGDTRYEVDWYMTQPTNPKRGAMCKINGVIKIYTNNSWQPIGGDDAAVHKADFAAVEQLPETFTENEMRTKLNTVISILKGTSAALLAALWILPASAGLEVQTAAKGDIKNTEQIVTNVTFSGESGLTTNDVREISSTQITNSVLAGYLCTSNAAAAMARGAYVAATNDASAKYIPFYEECNDNYKISKGIFCPYTYCDAVYVSDVYNLIYDGPTGHQSFKSYIDSATNALATVAHTGSYDDLSNRPTIPAPVSDSHITNIAEAVNATTRAIVTTWENFLDGSNVVFSITNYISGTYNLDAAKLRIMEMTNNVYREVYNSRDEILLHIDYFATNDFRVATNQVINRVESALATKADKAWGKYTSAGGEAPSNTVYMTAPNTVFAGGLEYERVAVGEGAVCILTTKGAPVWTQGDEGTFKFQDDGGTNYFGFAKTDSYVIGCDTDGISVQNNIVTLRYDITMSGVPCIWYKEDIASATPWEQLNTPDGNPIAGASHIVSWEQNPPAGQELCYINCQEAKGFFKATIEVAGSAKFMTNMPADLSGGIMCTNTATGVMGVIRPSYNGSSVNWNWSGL